MDRLSILTKHLSNCLGLIDPALKEALEKDLAGLKPRKERKPEPISFNEEEGEWVGITPAMLGKWATLFPGVDIKAELRKALAWLIGHPERRKQRYSAFLARWFSRAYQDTRPFPRTTGRQMETAEDRAARRAASDI